MANLHPWHVEIRWKFLQPNRLRQFHLMPESKSAKPNRKATLLRGGGNSPGSTVGLRGPRVDPRRALWIWTPATRAGSWARGIRRARAPPTPALDWLRFPIGWRGPLSPPRGNQERFPPALGRGLNLPSRASLLNPTRSVFNSVVPGAT